MKSLFTAALLFFLCAWQASAADAAKFFGTWQVEVDKTVAEGKRIKKIPSSVSTADFVREAFPDMTIQVTEKEVLITTTSSSTEKPIAMPYTVVSSTDTSAVLAVQQGERKGTMTFTLIDGKLMTMKYSISGDMNFYVWKKKAP